MGLFPVSTRSKSSTEPRIGDEKQRPDDPTPFVPPQDTPSTPLPIATEQAVTMNNQLRVVPPATKAKRFSFRRLSFVPHKRHPHVTEHKPAHSPTGLKVEPTVALQKHRTYKPVLSRSDRRAKKAALRLRSLMVGPNQSAPVQNPNITPADKPRLSKIRKYLLKPSSANKVIQELRALPPTDEEGDGAAKPIHAICLEHTDAEEDRLHFSRLHSSSMSTPTDTLTNVEALGDVLTSVKIVNLISPDLGLGQPADGEGLLAGALPTPETVLSGIKRITPELMALGFATGQAIVTDHTGIYPPTDRMSVITYWWGLEVLLPPPSLEFLSSVHSVSNAIVNFLSAFALVNQGAREVLPFVRYISQYIDYEFNAIKAKDKGHGVVCAATWIMPAAMIPRTWDFPIKPAEPNTLTGEKEAAGTENTNTSPSKPLLPIDEAIRKPLPPSPPIGDTHPNEPPLPVLAPHVPPISATPVQTALA